MGRHRTLGPVRKLTLELTLDNDKALKRVMRNMDEKRCAPAIRECIMIVDKQTKEGKR
jgi:hypothetical protein